MPEPTQTPEPTPLPRLPAALLRALLPYAERDEVLLELAAEYRARRSADVGGGWRARAWVWRQVLGSAPSLLRRGWWRGWSGFETRSERMKPGGAIMEGWAQDVRYAMRRLRKRPTYTGLVVLTLSLGVAGTAAVYGVASRLLLDPLPYAAEEEVALFWFGGSWSETEFTHVRPQMTGFQAVAAFRSADATLRVGDAPARLVRGYSATAELFDVLGAAPALGPGFQPGDDVLGAEPVVVIGHSLWRELGADPEIVGSRLELAGQTRTVAGVMPPGFWFPQPGVQIWLAEPLDPADGSGNHTLVGRVAPGESVARMGPHLSALAAILDERFDYPPDWDKTLAPELTPIRTHMVGSLRPSVLATLVAMAVILLIACVNVAALMLGQMDARGAELAVRGALGAGRERLLQQLTVEALALGALAAVAGAALAAAGFRLIVAALPLGALAETTAVDWRLFGAATGLALLAATLVSLVPGLSVMRSDPRDRLSTARSGGAAGRGGRLEGGLVIAQVALVLLMASGAALLIRSVENLRAIDPGVDVRGVAVLDVVIPTSSPPSERPQLVRELVAAVAALPGVESAAAAQRIPLRGSSNNWGIEVEGSSGLESTTTAFRPVTPGYLETMGVELLAGRTLQDEDRTLGASEGTVVINRTLADRYFPGEDPLGRRIRFMDRWDVVVGVVADVAEAGLAEGPVPARYQVYEQVPWLLPAESIVIRARPGQDAAALLDAARRAVQTAAPGVAVAELTTMQNVLNRAIGPALQVRSLLTLLSALALTLGVVGVYGVVSHFVSRRSRDWALRLALGLRPARVILGILARGGALVGAGILLGVGAFLFLARLLGSFLYGVEATDPLALAGAAAVLALAALAAAFVPALRASRIDPASALREP